MSPTRPALRLIPLVVVALLAAGCAYVPSQQTFDSPLASPAEKQIRIGPPIVYSPQPPSRGPYIPRFFGEPAESLAEAQARLGFQLLAPTVLPEGFDLVWIGTDVTSTLRLVYANGERYIHIGQGPNEDGYTPDENTPLSPGNVYFIIRDRPAMGHDRGVQFTPWFGPMLIVSPGYAYLNWWPEGLRVAMWPEDATVTLADLTMMAESMQPLADGGTGG